MIAPAPKAAETLVKNVLLLDDCFEIPSSMLDDMLKAVFDDADADTDADAGVGATNADVEVMHVATAKDIWNSFMLCWIRAV